MKHKIQLASFAIAFTTAMAGLPLSSVTAQTVEDDGNVGAGLELPNGQKFHASKTPNTRRATAIVNGEILTGTDIEHRLSLLLALRNANANEKEKEQFRPQVLASLIDETLQIQEAEANEITVSNGAIQRQAERRSIENFQVPFKDLSPVLEKLGSSRASFVRWIRGQVAWNSLLGRNIRVNVSDQEINTILDKLKADKGKTEYHIAETYLSYTPQTEAAVLENAKKILEQLGRGADFQSFAKRFSESSTAALGGDLGFVRLETLPESMAQALPTMQLGQMAIVPVPGGLTIMLLIDKKQILTTDTRDAVLNLKQISVQLPKDQSQNDISPLLNNFNTQMETTQKCEKAEQIAASINGEVGSNPRLPVRQLPNELQNIISQLEVGQSSSIFNINGGLTTFILCGRTVADEAKLPSVQEIRNKLENERVERRAEIYLRDLRRDAIIEYN